MTRDENFRKTKLWENFNCSQVFFMNSFGVEENSKFSVCWLKWLSQRWSEVTKSSFRCPKLQKLPAWMKRESHDITFLGKSLLCLCFFLVPSSFARITKKGQVIKRNSIKPKIELFCFCDTIHRAFVLFESFSHTRRFFRQWKLMCAFTITILLSWMKILLNSNSPIKWFLKDCECRLESKSIIFA